MKREFLTYLQCIKCRHDPFDLIELETKSMDNEKDIIVIENGILFCSNCNYFYPIIEGIPIILPDDLRDKNKDIEFLKKWKLKIPEKIIKEGNPWHL